MSDNKQVDIISVSSSLYPRKTFPCRIKRPWTPVVNDNTNELPKYKGKVVKINEQKIQFE